MQRDLLIIGVGMIAVSIITWSSWRDPGVVPRMHTVETLDKDPEVKVVTERSPYMRSER
jgi:hypothetical protein